MSADDLVVRLQAALDEKERVAKAATQGAWRWRDAGSASKMALTANPPGTPWPGRMVVPSAAPDVFPSAADAKHQEANDPEAVLRLVQAHRDLIALFPVSAPHLDTEGSFYGFQSRDCGEHRTVGSHRAWCYDCSEWCYPNDPCGRCHGVSEVLRILARGYGVEDTDG